MKKHFTFLFGVLLLLPIITQAQTKIKVEEVIKEMSKGMQNGYEVLVPEVTLKNTRLHLNKYLRKDSNGKVIEKNNEMSIVGAVSRNISPGLFNVYVKFLETDDGVRITAFFADNDSSSFYSTAVNEDQSSAVKKYLKDFAVKEYKEVTKHELEDQERKQKNLEIQLEYLIKAKQKSEKNISEAKRTIANNNKEIELNNKQDTVKAAEVERQKEIANSLKGTGGDEEKLANKNLKIGKNEKRKLEKEKESLAREIDKMNTRIEDELRNIENNKKLQEDKNKEIEKQKEKIKKTDEKLNNIN